MSLTDKITLVDLVLNFLYDEARQRIEDNPICVYDTCPITKQTALHFLCYFSNWKSFGYSDQSIDEYSDVCQYFVNLHFRGYNKYNGHELKENVLKSNQALWKIMDLAQLIITTSHMLLQKPEVVSHYTMHSIEHSILICKDCAGNTPLHALFEYWYVDVDMMSLIFNSCQKDPSSQGSMIPTVIELIVHKNERQETPMHFASQCICSFSAWKFLLEQVPAGNDRSMLLMRDSFGQTPLHLAFINGISVRRLKLYLKKFTKDKLYIQDRKNMTPLQGTLSCRFESYSNQYKWCRYAAIMNVILENNNPIPPMFALAGLSDMTPTHILMLGLQLYQEGLDDMDDKGQCPLHVAGMCPSREWGNTPFLRLLKANPSAAQQRCHQGQLPLHYVLKTGKSLDCVKALVLEHPDGLNETDPVTGLPCFLLAMVGTDGSLTCSENQLNNCYFLLQENPAMIVNLGNGC